MDRIDPLVQPAFKHVRNNLAGLVEIAKSTSPAMRDDSNALSLAAEQINLHAATSATLLKEADEPRSGFNFDALKSIFASLNTFVSAFRPLLAFSDYGNKEMNQLVEDTISKAKDLLTGSETHQLKIGVEELSPDNYRVQVSSKLGEKDIELLSFVLRQGGELYSISMNTKELGTSRTEDIELTINNHQGIVLVGQKGLGKSVIVEKTGRIGELVDSLNQSLKSENRPYQLGLDIAKSMARAKRDSFADNDEENKHPKYLYNCFIGFDNKAETANAT